MKKIILIVIASLSASSAMAMSRYNSEALSCSTIHDKIAADGAVVLQHASGKANGPEVYDRYVSSQAGCMEWGGATKASVPSSDDPNCKVQYCAILTGKGHTHS